MSQLFSQGHPLSGNQGLTEFLMHREKMIVSKILAVKDIRELTDEFLQNLVKDSFIQPIVLYSTDKKRKTKIESKLVTICVPFVGDQELFVFCPNPCELNRPYGRIFCGNIEFDVTINENNMAKEINSNIAHIERFLIRVNQQVKEFNVNLLGRVKVAFNSKISNLLAENEKTNKEIAALNSLDIPELIETKLVAETSLLPDINNSVNKKIFNKSKRESNSLIFIKIEKMFVNQFNQTNNNKRDVNNEIQSNQ
jgi:hypothetical protein